MNDIYSTVSNIKRLHIIKFLNYNSQNNKITVKGADDEGYIPDMAEIFVFVTGLFLGFGYHHNELVQECYR
jgi:hypothetical protein